MAVDDDSTNPLPRHLRTTDEAGFLGFLVGDLEDFELPGDLVDTLRDTIFTEEYKNRLLMWLWDRQAECLNAVKATVEARINHLRNANKLAA